MKKLIIIIAIILGIIGTTNAKSVINQGFINGDYDTIATVIRCDGTKKVYSGVRILPQYNNENWVWFETEDGRVYQININGCTTVQFED